MNIEQEQGIVIPLKDGNGKANILPSLAISLTESKERINSLQEFVKEMMIEGIDYGVFEGYQKPSLLKPGAEKLCDVFGFSKYISIINRIENWDAGLFAYDVKVTLKSKRNGFTEAEGIGNCNSKEKSFINQDPFSIVNTLLKMAEKRALVDAVLSATRASGIFTQDIEDFPKLKKYKEGDDLVTARQLQRIFRTITNLKINPETAKEIMKMNYLVERSTQLTKKQASSFIQDLELLKQVP
ncbi:hypothetical protein QE429_003868 [Bacillus sp. SORGH_AS 510]|uniref:hypothetical protein n=1 Tax=Bacillus sp. SORGH_AS_0510 TaxID=3041771 RepID=UPI002788AB12|nr:hypothetical protein [Bacillus sp. SORGH_AS_0510]MDQ1147041.1 hypothetical protein [Bacillus sp. SORGH_AS_0510]